MTRKKYLIVAMEMGDSAPGTVFKTLAKSLYQYADLDIISPVFDENFSLDGIRTTRLHHYKIFSWEKIRQFWKLYHFNPYNQWWILTNLHRAFKSIKGQQYDGVISFTSMNYFPSISLGRIIAKKLGVAWAIYSVDGIPSPVEWLGGDSFTHSRLAAHINQSCKKADFIFSSNEYMMGYQQRICPDFKGVWSYLYTPHKQTQNYEKTTHKGYRFLYTGALYGLRKIDGLLAGFRRFVKEYPASQMIFVGDADPSFFDSAQDLFQNENILLKPFSKDLTAYYQDADVLMDIGADIPNDVFLSSKIISYLPIDRPILAITGENSPARGIMGGLRSILHCCNQEEDAYQAMKSCVELITTPESNFTCDRAELIHDFDAETIARKLFDTLSHKA